MATVDLITSGGISSVAQPVKFRSASCVTRAGLASSTGRVAWAGSASALSKVPWLPPAHVKPIMPDGSWNPQVYRALKYLFDDVIGGISAPTLPQVRQDVSNTQTQVQDTTNYAMQVSQYAQGVAATAQATAAVAEDNGLSGSESIPPSPPPPDPPIGRPTDPV